MKQKCPYCGNQLHLSLLGEGITDAFCMKCKVDIPLDKIVFKDESIVCDENGYCNEPIKSESGCFPVAVTGFVVLAMLIVMSTLMTSCRTVYVPVETKTTVTETVRDTVIKTLIEKEYVKNVTQDTTSTVETKYARSTATYHGDTGLLEHDIENKKDSIPVNAPVKEKLVVIEKPVPCPIEKLVQVEKKLTWWQNLKMETGGISLGILFVILICFLLRIIKAVKSVGLAGVWKIIFKKHV